MLQSFVYTYLHLWLITIIKSILKKYFHIGLFMKQKRLFWQLFIPTAFVLALLCLVLYSEMHDQRAVTKQNAINQVQYQVHLLKNEIEGELLSVERDLVRLRNEQGILDFLKQSTPEQQAEVEQAWMNMLTAHPNFQQIRFLDNSGIEQIRVEREAISGRVIASNDKQNKLDRTYVQNGLSLSNNEIIVSDFDLNQEFGEIEYPIRPTIRFIIKFGDTDAKQGILVINYLCVGLFSNLDSLIDTRLNLLNQNGYYLHSNQHDKNWGWLLGDPAATVSTEMPRLWFKLSRLSKSGVQNDESMVFGKIQLTPAGINTQYPKLFFTYPLTAEVLGAQSLFDNTYLWLIVLCALLFVGTMIWVYLTLIDAAKERERTEEATYKAQRALSVKSKFLANMSHEIRTPLNGIMGFLQLLALEPLNKKQHGFAQNGLKSTRLLSQILNDILDFSKLEANKLTLQQAPFSLHDMINDIGSLMSGSLQGKRLELWLDIEPNIDLDVVGDEIRLRQILVNLTSNAIKFTEEGFVKIKLTQTGQTETDVTLKFEISDSGIGLNNEQLTRIFNSFEQASMEVNKKYGGTGLGLNISENLLSLMGSKLNVVSKPMIGSTFWFEITLEKSQNTANRLSIATTQNLNKELLKKLNILLYSQNSIGKTILDKICENFEWQSIHASSVDKVLEILQAGIEHDDQPLINVVVVDKPEITDITWKDLHKIKNKVIGDDAPLIYLLITLSTDLTQEFDKLQMNLIDGHFIKPITPSIFYEEIAAKLLEKMGHKKEHIHDDVIELAGLDILLVEDNFINQEVVTNMLANLKAHVTVAENGRVALDILLEQPERFDLILMDMQMPVMDGVTATTHIRQQLELTEIPIIAMTANAMATDKQMCFDAGMNDHLAKPFDQKMLVDKIIANIANA